MSVKERIPMRMVFGEHLVRLGDRYPDIVVLDADVSCSTQTRLFQEKFPDRFINCGIAEANMVSVAAGISTTGLKPVVSTFAFLLATRASDQIRSQIAYSRLGVIMAGGYSGLSDFADGGSHQSVMDLAVFLAMPNMTVICPGDATETELALEAAILRDGPVYIRLSRAEVGRLPYPEPFRIGQSLTRTSGDDLTIISTGQMLETALDAAGKLKEEGIHARLIDMHTVKPLDKVSVLKAARECRALVTCEENSVVGGMGSLVAGYLAEELPTPIRMIGIQDMFGQSGSYEEHKKHYGLAAEDILRAAYSIMKDKQN